MYCKGVYRRRHLNLVAQALETYCGRRDKLSWMRACAGPLEWRLCDVRREAGQRGSPASEKVLSASSLIGR